MWGGGCWDFWWCTHLLDFFFLFLVLARKILDERLLFFLLMHLDFSFKQNMVDRPITAPTLVAFGISNSELRFIFNCSMIFLTSWKIIQLNFCYLLQILSFWHASVVYQALLCILARCSPAKLLMVRGNKLYVLFRCAMWRNKVSN